MFASNVPASRSVTLCAPARRDGGRPYELPAGPIDGTVETSRLPHSGEKGSSVNSNWSGEAPASSREQSSRLIPQCVRNLVPYIAP
jgi:hypothetical protein